MSYMIPNPSLPEDFIEVYNTAGKHLQHYFGDKLNWVNPSPFNITLSPLTFRLGNQLFFVYVETENHPFYPYKEIFLSNSTDAHAIPTIIQLNCIKDGKSCIKNEGSGLIHAETMKYLEPENYLTNDLIEISDWELLDFAVQIVADQLEKDGFSEIVKQCHLKIDPSIWFKDKELNPGYIVVRAIRFPKRTASRPEGTLKQDINNKLPNAKSFFASVGVAHADQKKQENDNKVVTLWRGAPYHVLYTGLETL